MAITSALTNSFVTEILKAEHDFTSTGDTFTMALYVTATMDKTNTIYTTTDEVADGGGYTAPGLDLTSVTPVYETSAGICDFSPDATWSSSTITAEGCMIYNNTHATDAAVMVLDFGGSQSSSSGDFTVQFPAATGAAAIIQITN